ncbi:MAG TPA: DUF72 domain-containing protein [Terriglobales bacterium]|jgi:uncharacterized protein YecE (DUF72 family)|nr:DUF72 domain-containing protein [Terriglobales bacterium]
MARVYAGTSGWAYATWKPDFYPAKLAAAKFLSYYATRLNSVELNYTFRRFPTEKLLTGWIESTPADFKFAVKAHQTITHIKRLRDTSSFTADFLAALDPLKEAGKLGPVLFQLPPFLKCDLDLLAQFLDKLPPQIRAAFEFRHPSWFNEEVYALLRKADAAMCQAESEKLETPDVQTASFAYLRLRKEEYSAKERKQVSAEVSNLTTRGDVFVYFKHEETAEGALYAECLISETSNSKA